MLSDFLFFAGMKGLFGMTMLMGKEFMFLMMHWSGLSLLRFVVFVLD